MALGWHEDDARMRVGGVREKGREKGHPKDTRRTREAEWWDAQMVVQHGCKDSLRTV